MIDVAQIVSYCQTSIGDEAGERVGLAEYVDLLNDTAMDIAEQTEIWINRYVNTPNPLVLGWLTDYNYSAGQITTVSNSYYYCNIGHTSGTWATDLAAGYWTIIPIWSAGLTIAVDDKVYMDGPIFYIAKQAHTTSLDNMPDDTDYWLTLEGGASNIFSVNLPYTFTAGDLAPFRIIRVVRGDGTTWNETVEYSQQSIARTTSGNYSFKINTTVLGANDFAVQLINLANSVDNSMTLVFGKEFDSDEQVVIDYISNRPFSANPFTQWLDSAANPNRIPDWTRNAFEWGLKSKVYHRLFDKGDDNMKGRLILAIQKYEKALLDATAYAKGLKGNQNSLQIQPRNFLAESTPRIGNI